MVLIRFGEEILCV